MYASSYTGAFAMAVLLTQVDLPTGQGVGILR